VGLRAPKLGDARRLRRALDRRKVRAITGSLGEFLTVLQRLRPQTLSRITRPSRPCRGAASSRLRASMRHTLDQLLPLVLIKLAIFICIQVRSQRVLSPLDRLWPSLESTRATTGQIQRDLLLLSVTS